jgi:cytochrome d ubiquinol oxidase subunit II
VIARHLQTAIVASGAWRAIPGPHDGLPFLLAIALFLLAFLGLGISLWPYAVPYAATLWQAASSPPTLAFVSIDTAVIVSIVIGYFGFAYWVFRGKTTGQTRYGH